MVLLKIHASISDERECIRSIHTYIHAYIHTYTHSIHTYTHTHIHPHTYIHTYKHTYIHAYIHTYIVYIHTYTHTHTHTNIYTYIHAYIHTYIIPTYLAIPVHLLIPMPILNNYYLPIYLPTCTCLHTHIIHIATRLFGLVRCAVLICSNCLANLRTYARAIPRMSTNPGADLIVSTLWRVGKTEHSVRVRTCMCVCACV